MGYLDNRGLAYLWSKLKSSTVTLTLSASRWTNRVQLVSVSKVTSNNVVLVSVDDNTFGIKCVTQGTSVLGFSCETVPTTNINVTVTILS